MLCLLATNTIACQRDSVKLAEAEDALKAGNTEKAIELLTPIAESTDSPESVKADMDLAKIFLQLGNKDKARNHIVNAAKKGEQDAAKIAVEGYLKGNEVYGFTRSDTEAMKLLEQLHSVCSPEATFQFNEQLVKLYLFSPECKNPIKAADIVTKHQCENWEEYRAVLKYMGAGGIPQDLKSASELLNHDPLPETAVYMGHLAMLQMLKDGNYPEQKVMLALKYYNLALNESEYIDKQAISGITEILNRFLKQFQSRTLNSSPYHIHKRNISGGWGEYRNSNFDYCGAIANGYPNGLGVGATEYQNAYCGNWKNGRYDKDGIQYDLKGNIWCGTWSSNDFSNGFHISSKGEITRLN